MLNIAKSVAVFFQQLGWEWLAVTTGILFGIGIIRTRISMDAGMSFTLILMVWGIVWFMPGSVGLSVGAVKPAAIPLVIGMIIAGALFYFGNFAQYYSMARAPLSGFTLIIVAAVSTMVVTIYELITKWWNDEAIPLTPRKVIACAAAAVLFYALASDNAK